MRIVLVLPTRSDPAHHRVGAELGRALSSRGHAVFLFPPHDGLTARQAGRSLERLLVEERIDVCHVQFFSRGLSYLSGARIPARTRVVLTHQGASIRLLESPRSFGALSRRAAVVTAVSAPGLAELRGRFPGSRGKSCVVPNGAARAQRGSGGSAPRRPYILCVSRLAAYKGIDILAVAFSGLAARAQGLDLVICGPDQTGGRLRRFIARLGLGRRVRLLGKTAPGRVARLMAGCRFFVLPSREENMPMALLEAMAAGKALIASDVGGVGQVVEDGVSGLLVAPRDPEALLRAMRLLATDAALRRRLGRRARARAELFGWPSVAARYEALYGPAALRSMRTGRSRGS